MRRILLFPVLLLSILLVFPSCDEKAILDKLREDADELFEPRLSAKCLISVSE